MHDFSNYKWIKFSEMAPLIGMNIVCVFDKATFDDDIIGVISFYGRETGYGYDETQRIIAWMPLPQYQE